MMIYLRVKIGVKYMKRVVGKRCKITVLFKEVLNSLLLPYRLLFKYQGFGSFLMSIEEERFRRVARYCTKYTLDVGCGPYNKFIRRIYSNGMGVDFYPYEGVDHILKDPTNFPFEDNTFDTVTLNAVGGHIPKHLRKKEFKEFSRVLKRGGRFIMDEGGPITQYLQHKYVRFSDVVFRTKLDVDTERGMDKNEQYCMPKREIISLIQASGMKLIKIDYFQWGLKKVFVAEKL